MVFGPIPHIDSLSVNLRMFNSSFYHRMQAQQSHSSDAYKGMGDVFWRTFKHEGYLGFYKGLFPNLLKVVPAASITYMVYEAMKKSLELD